MHESTEQEFRQALVWVFPAAVFKSVETLTGGVSALTHKVMAHIDGQLQALVIRRYMSGERDHQISGVEREAALLKVLHAYGFAVPAVWGYDTRCEIWPTPYLVLSFLSGTTAGAPVDRAAACAMIAETMVAIHTRIEPAELPRLPLLKQRLTTMVNTPPANMNDLLQEPAIRAAVARHWSQLTWLPPTLLHGDLWPGNILWQGQHLQAVLDWESAKWGDPRFDIANTRLELQWAWGDAAPELFTAAYARLRPEIDLTSMPIWDLVAALGPINTLFDWFDSTLEQDRLTKGHRTFVNRALQGLED